MVPPQTVKNTKVPRGRRRCAPELIDVAAQRGIVGFPLPGEIGFRPNSNSCDLEPSILSETRVIVPIIMAVIDDAVAVAAVAVTVAIAGAVATVVVVSAVGGLGVGSCRRCRCNHS